MSYTTRLDRYIRRKFGHISQSIIENALRNKDIIVNGNKAKASDQVKDSDNIFIHPKIMAQFNNTFVKKDYSKYLEQFKSIIVYEDDDLLVVNKPAGMAVQLGSGTNVALDVIAKEYNPELRLVHRIDKETSGLTVMVKNIETARYMLDLFKNKKVQKTYIAHLSNKLKINNGIINAPLIKLKDKVVVDFEKGKEAITKFKLIKNENGHSIVEVHPLTGRTHQIRVHFSYVGSPILGDRRYGGAPSPHLCLFASEIKFRMNGRELKLNTTHFI